MTLPTLTNSQRDASYSPADRLYIESVPGSGKTTVAAERFGALRYTNPSTSRALGLSFTRAATAQLRSRIEKRWGPHACRWPHRVITFDTLVRDLVGYLLRTGLISWPQGHTELDVLDHWRGRRGFHWLEAGSWVRVIKLDDTTVSTEARRLRTPRPGFSRKADLEDLLSSGLCTHEELRVVLWQAIGTEKLASAIRAVLAGLATDVLVDEVFDANPLDVWLIDALNDEATTLTLIGDPWQAIYGFRQARPDLVNKHLADGGYDKANLPDSHRFRTEQTHDTAGRLRQGAPVDLPAVTAPLDVVLASHWDHLWELAGPDVLPLSIGQLRNQTDAALLLLLDHVVRAKLGRRAVFSREAAHILGVAENALEEAGASLFAQVLEVFDAHGPGPALEALRVGAKDILGAPRKPPRGRRSDEAAELTLALICSRSADGDKIPGLTVHQAKGCEWEHVGFAGPEEHYAALAAGLSVDDDFHRVLYVALTRARDTICRA